MKLIDIVDIININNIPINLRPISNSNLEGIYLISFTTINDEDKENYEMCDEKQDYISKTCCINIPDLSLEQYVCYSKQDIFYSYDITLQRINELQKTSDILEDCLFFIYTFLHEVGHWYQFKEADYKPYIYIQVDAEISKSVLLQQHDLIKQVKQIKNEGKSFSGSLKRKLKKLAYEYREIPHERQANEYAEDNLSSISKIFFNSIKGSRNSKRKDLFFPVVPRNKMSDYFLSLYKEDNYFEEPTRSCMNEVFQDYEDKDGNFVEQFQTTGFSARCFELYLDVVFKELGFHIIHGHKYPDFILEKNGTRIAVEATTANPSNSIETEATDGLLSHQDIIDNEVPIKLGSAIYNKMKKQYWNEEHCSNIPFIIAVEDFHKVNSLQFTLNSLMQYLYGMKYYVEDEDGIINKTHITDHRVGDKCIKSGIFFQEEYKNLSAILFTNSGSSGKFKRMGFNKGYYYGGMFIYREGYCHNHTPGAIKPAKFKINLNNNYDEKWADEIMIFLNPNAINPVPDSLFRNVAKTYIKDNEILQDIPEFYVYTSITPTEIFDDLKDELPDNVKNITKYQRDQLLSQYKDIDKVSLSYEILWYYNDKSTDMGIVLGGKVDKDYSVIRMHKFSDGYRCDYSQANISKLDDAKELILKILH